MALLVLLQLAPSVVHQALRIDQVYALPRLLLAEPVEREEARQLLRYADARTPSTEE